MAVQANTFPGHNSSLFVLGVMILWFGWYGFNPGSQQAIIGYSSSVGTAAVTTTLAPASAGLSAVTTAAMFSVFEDGARPNRAARMHVAVTAASIYA